MQKINKLIKSFKENGYHDVVVEKENEEFIKYLTLHGLKKELLTNIVLSEHWELCFKQKLKINNINKKLKIFKDNNTFNINIKFVDVLPVINTLSTTILINNSISDEFYKHWREFQKLIYNSEIAPDRLAKSDFKFEDNWTYNTILDKMPTLDESNKKRARQKKLYYLFFLFLTSIRKALLPTQYIMSEDTFYNFTSRREVLIFFKKDHFFTTKPINKNLIEDELNVNAKAKFINYMRFSYLVNYDITLLKSLTNDDTATIINNLKNSGRSSEMVTVYENPIRKILYWHGAINIDQTRKEANDRNITPLEILYQIKQIDKRYIKVFYPYFSQKPNNEEQKKYARNIKKLIEFLAKNLEELNSKNLKKFFSTSISKENDLDKLTLKSDFLDYLYMNINSKTLQQEIQMIVFQSFGNYEEFNNCFLKSDIHTIYKTPKNRKVSRLALDKRILIKMKEICIFRPIFDNYYIKTNINKSNYNWKHFENTEPQLPVMLFLYLSMPWRKEHIVSMDRENFIKTNENGELIEVHITTDKNQQNNFIIEKEFFEYAITFKDLEGKEHCPLDLIIETINYSKDSFPLMRPTYRKGNENWGKIKPILCKNTSHGFTPNYVFDGYYYKVFIQALFELDYPPEKISYFIQLSKLGLNVLNNYANIYSSINEITLQQSSRYFNSNYFSPHSIRKTNITYLVNDKKTFEFIIKLSGHRAMATVLSIYIDYNMLSRLNINENIKTAISDNFRQVSRVEVRKIIDNFQKYHLIDSNDIIKKITEKKLFFSPLILSDSKILIKNKKDNFKILEPKYWEELVTGICTNGLNCEEGNKAGCSICPYFLTNSNFTESIQSKIMQLSSKSIEYFNIIIKHIEDEELTTKEAIIYEEELQLVLAQLEGYAAIVDKINKEFYVQISEGLSPTEKNNLPIPQDAVILKYEHKSHMKAQLEIYKHSKLFYDHNEQIEHSIDCLYTKILELLLLNEIPQELFKNIINNSKNKEVAIEKFLELIELDKNNPIPMRNLIT